MSVKHVKEYFNEICGVYHELLDNVKELEKDASQGLISPERLELYKKNLEPIKTNYERWSYMMFLLNKPNKKSNQKKYDKQHKKQLQEIKEKHLDTADISESKEALKKLKV